MHKRSRKLAEPGHSGCFLRSFGAAPPQSGRAVGGAICAGLCFFLVGIPALRLLLQSKLILQSNLSLPGCI
jgi:hypothetical protein